MRRVDGAGREDDRVLAVDLLASGGVHFARLEREVSHELHADALRAVEEEAGDGDPGGSVQVGTMQDLRGGQLQAGKGGLTGQR